MRKACTFEKRLQSKVIRSYSCKVVSILSVLGVLRCFSYVDGLMQVCEFALFVKRSPLIQPHRNSFSPFLLHPHTRSFLHSSHLSPPFLPFPALHVASRVVHIVFFAYVTLPRCSTRTKVIQLPSQTRPDAKPNSYHSSHLTQVWCRDGLVGSRTSLHCRARLFRHFADAQGQARRHARFKVFPQEGVTQSHLRRRRPESL